MMRFIDRRAGVPLCFVLSCVHSLAKIIRKPEPFKSPKKILFIELSEMGSILLAYSLFEKTKKMFPEAELYFLTFRENRCAVDVLGVFPEENVFTISSRNFIEFMTTTAKTLQQLRKKKINVCIDMELFARFTAILGYLCGAKSRVGFYRYHNEGLYRGNFLTHKVEFNPYIHLAHNLLNLIDALAAPKGEIPLTKKPVGTDPLRVPKMNVSEKLKIDMLAKLQDKNKNLVKSKKIVLLNPNASDLVPVRRWPAENYAELAKLLLQHQDVYIVITGTDSEREYAQGICEAVGSSRCINFAGKTTFLELLTLYSLSDILVTNDSGPVHFSSLTDIKTFALYGPETPKLYGPLGKNCRVFYANYACSPCISAFNQRRSPCNDNKCLKAISAAEVYEEVKKYL